MSTFASPIAPPRRLVLADLVPAVRNRTVLLVIAGAVLTALASQIRIPLGFTPVPINLATFAAVLTGGALGARRGAASMGLYLGLGIVGMPVFADWSGGWSVFTGATGGYLICYPLMAIIVGAAAERGRDRHVVPFVAAIVLANAVVYIVGAAWLAHVVDVPMFGDPSAWTLGVRPFLAGDVVKMLAAGLLFPAAWRFADGR
ncbi:biotin transporter BioY [Ilumatobacter nonamiensis]|uniref:biotin transporter BioY n=1 Tax=Ilumatobacter nonamiensis TaxID=467093 RepID=UPI0019D3A578|nr:biotin transporter BioY [Ilumatobacter nonamiensis]